MRLDRWLAPVALAKGVVWFFFFFPFFSLPKGQDMLHIHVHINGKGAYEVSAQRHQSPLYTEDLRQVIRTLAEPGDSGYITQHKPPHPSITHRFQLDTQARIRFTSTYTA
jgi:hypothetical protein